MKLIRGIEYWAVMGCVDQAQEVRDGVGAQMAKFVFDVRDHDSRRHLCDPMGIR
jgi:hypothetical protein